MAYSRRRPTGGYGVSVYATPSKDTFEEAVETCGKTYTVERVNVGAWNEGREFRVDGKMVGFVFKGERAKWDSMAREVERATAAAKKEG